MITREKLLEKEVSVSNAETLSKLLEVHDNIKEEVKKGVNITHTHSFKEIEEVKRLLNEIKNIDIPKEIELKKSVEYTYSHSYIKFLWYFFSISMIIIAFCVWFGLQNFENWENYRDLEKHNKLLMNYYHFMDEKCPKSSQEWKENIKAKDN